MDVRTPQNNLRDEFNMVHRKYFQMLSLNTSKNDVELINTREKLNSLLETLRNAPDNERNLRSNQSSL